MSGGREKLCTAGVHGRDERVQADLTQGGSIEMLHGWAVTIGRLYIGLKR